MHRPSNDLTEPARNIEESNGISSKETETMDVDQTSPRAEDEDIDEGMRDNDQQIYTPPPRIAARFYKPSQSRRKDSAASSRRNSVSSVHSRCSSIHQGTDGTGHNKQVAQHLRRASFLEDRRARLADRAAHAEKVRLRAAMAKVAKFTSNSEERALAAQLARERNLAEIVANCAEEVKKAKQVAEQIREKREQEAARLKQQMDERMAEVEKRRTEELRTKSSSWRSRGHSVAAARKPNESVLPAAIAKKPHRSLPRAEAATKIQYRWRAYSRKQAIKEFNNLGLTVDGIRETSFNTVTELLNQDKVILLTARLLRVCGLQEGEPGSIDEATAVRIFLSAFLILGHPTQVLSNKNGEDSESGPGMKASHRLPAADLENPQLKDLIDKAKDLLISFEKIMTRLSPSNLYTTPPALMSSLPDSYAIFHNAFTAWKSRDSNALVEVMLMQFVELDAILQSVKDTTDDSVGEVYRQSIRDNQLLLMVRIKRLVGQEPGKRMIFKAVIDARKKATAKSNKKETGDTKPRVAEHFAPSEETSGPAASVTMHTSQTATPPPTPARKAEPSKAAPLVSMGIMQGLFEDNRQVTHELAINKEYHVPVDEYKAKTAAFLEPFYEQMRRHSGGERGEANFKSFIFIIENIKERLQRLLKKGKPMYNMVEEVLDPVMVQRRFVQGAFSYEKFFADMAAILPQLCAPARDEEAQELIRVKFREDDVIDRVIALNGFIDTMLCDYVNYLLRMVAPQLIEAAPQYEAKRFNQDLTDGKIGLQVAESAWTAARSKVTAEAQRRDPEGINHPKARPTAGRIYAQMLVDLATQPLPLQQDSIPEMLRLDISRFEQVSMNIQHVVTAGAVLLQCKNVLKRDVRAPWRMEASRLLTILSAPHSSLDTMEEAAMAALEAGRSMPAASKAHIRALARRTLAAGHAMSTEGTEPTEPVMRLLLGRLRGIILTRLSPASASEKVKAATMSSEKLASLGLPEFVDLVRQSCDVLERVGSADRAAHSAWWDAVATKVVEDEAN